MSMFKNNHDWTLLNSEPTEFNFEINPFQILSDIEVEESLHTKFYDINFDKFTEDKAESKINSNKEINICDESQICDVLELNSYKEGIADLTSKEIFEVKPSHQLNQANTSNIMKDKLDSIFLPRRNRCSILANRRDVINKVILRGFKRFFVKLLNPKDDSACLPSTKSIKNDEVKIITRAFELGLQNLIPINSSIDSFRELIGFLGCVKVTKQVRKMFSSDNLAINLLEDILTSYSHRKLKQILSNNDIKALFEYFIVYGKERFIAGLKSNSHQNSNTNHDIKEINNGVLNPYDEAFQELLSQM